MVVSDVIIGLGENVLKFSGRARVVEGAPPKVPMNSWAVATAWACPRAVPVARVKGWAVRLVTAIVSRWPSDTEVVASRPSARGPGSNRKV